MVPYILKDIIEDGENMQSDFLNWDLATVNDGQYTPSGDAPRELLHKPRIFEIMVDLTIKVQARQAHNLECTSMCLQAFQR